MRLTKKLESYHSCSPVSTSNRPNIYIYIYIFFLIYIDIYTVVYSLHSPGQYPILHSILEVKHLKSYVQTFSKEIGDE